jgi:hypothetical protein
MMSANGRNQNNGKANPLLDCHVSSVFAREQYLWRCTSKIRAMGIVTLGDLLERNLEKVFRELDTSEKNVARMKRILKRVTSISAASPH